MESGLDCRAVPTQTFFGARRFPGRMADSLVGDRRVDGTHANHYQEYVQ